MRKIKSDFERYGDAALLVLVEFLLLSLTGNIFFPVIAPSLANFQTAITAYSTALSAAQNRGKAEIAAKNARRQELIDLLLSLANDITKQADGSEEALVSSGFPLTKTRQPKPPMGIPVIAKIEVSDNAGQIDVTLDSLDGARTFVYRYTPDPIVEGSVWASRNSTLVKQTFTGLETGKRYWIQIVAYGTNNQMTMCDPVLSKIVQ